jgi:hypothetical protein
MGKTQEKNKRMDHTNTNTIGSEPTEERWINKEATEPRVPIG